VGPAGAAGAAGAADVVPAVDVLPLASEITLCVVVEPPDPLPLPVEALPLPVEALPEPVEALPEPVEALPEPEEALPVPEEALPEPVDELPEPVDALPVPVDALPEEVELAGKPSLPSRASCALAVARVDWSVLSCCSSVVTACCACWMLIVFASLCAEVGPLSALTSALSAIARLALADASVLRALVGLIFASACPALTCSPADA
jgi:hypothetical protein